ncbi:substrate-binding periplasmic protein [Radicibacter daui]|uniref:substrate-binding periplasmic protein n=1 Tax=Radicibacter daui TaxID=3064829 RepID=UPI004046F4B9
MLLPAGSRAQTGIPAPAKPYRGPLAFCYSIFPPYTDTVNGQAEGISISILAEASRRAGFAASFAELPWARCLQQVQESGMDVAIDSAPRPGFLMGPTSPTLLLGTIFVRRDDGRFPGRSTGYAMLAGHSVGIVAGYITDSLVADNPAVHFEQAPSDFSLARMLELGRVDAAITDYAAMTYIVRGNHLPLRALRPAVQVWNGYPAFEIHDAERQRALDTELAAMMSDGTIDAIYEQQLGMSYGQLRMEFSPR